MQPPVPCLGGRQPGRVGGAPRQWSQPSCQGQRPALPPLHPDAAGADGDGEQVRGRHERYEAEGDRPGETEEVLQAEFRLDAADDGS